MNKTKAREDLQQAVESLYAVFSEYPLRSYSEVSELGVSQDAYEQVQAVPLRELTAADLSEYARHVLGITYWGSVDDFKHFLPRLCEVILTQSAFLVAPLELGWSLEYAGWSTWSASEHAAVEAYIMAFWRFMLACFPFTHSIDEVLSAIADCHDDLGPYLSAWRSEHSVPALRHLAEFVYVHANSLFLKNKLGEGGWTRRPAQMQQVIAWLLDPLTVQILEQGFFAHADAPFAEELATASDQLVGLHERLGKNSSVQA